MSVLSRGSFEHVQNFPPDKTDRDVSLMYVRYPLPYDLFGTRALHLLYLSGYYPLISGGITTWHSSCNTDPSVPIYTPGIYADGYIVFAFPFVCSSVRMFVRSFVRGICVKVLR